MAISNEEKLRRLHQNKINAIKKYEKEYWRKIKEFKSTFSTSASALEENLNQYFPDSSSSFVFVGTDGVIIERCLVNEKRNAFIVNYIPKSIEHILSPVPVVSVDGKIINSMMKLGVGDNVTFQNFQINDDKIESAEITSFLFSTGKTEITPIEEAIEDLRLFLIGSSLGLLKNEGTVKIKPSVVEKLEKIVMEFSQLLEYATREEKIQIFLKENTILIDQYSERIPKQKLGDDFITDFVLLNNLDQGPVYTLVEIERASATIFTSTDDFSADFRHAEKQILEWDLWLEKNKAYLQNKLKGFESPKFKIIMGRSNRFTDNQKGLIRAWTRHQKCTELITYDDILVKANELIGNLKKMEITSP